MEILKVIRDSLGRYSVIFNIVPDMVYEKAGLDYVGAIRNNEREIIASHWLEKKHYGNAFAGRELSLRMKDGTTQKIKNNWFDSGSYPEHGEFISIGAGTLEELQRCFVFYSFNINIDAFQKMLDDYLTRDKVYQYNEVREWCRLQYKWYDVYVHGKRIPFMMNKKGEVVTRLTKERVYPKHIVARIINGAEKRYTYFKLSYREEDELVKLEANFDEVMRDSLPQYVYKKEEVE